MSITPINNNYHPSFGSVNLIQVSKEAFKSPNDLTSVSREFTIASNKASREINQTLAALPTLFGLGKYFNKTMVYLEQPGYTSIDRTLKESGGYSFSWLEQNTGIPIAKPLSEKYHSFFVLTKKQKNKAISFFNIKNMYKLLKKSYKEGFKEIKDDKRVQLEDTWLAAKNNQNLIEEFKPIFDGQPVKKFVINDLSQLKNISKKFD